MPSTCIPQGVTATQSELPSAGPKEVPEIHDVHEESAVGVPSTKRDVPSRVLPVHALRTVHTAQLSPLVAAQVPALQAATLV